MVLGDSCPSRDAPGLRKNLWTRPGAASGDCRAVDQKLRDRTSTKASPQQTACRVASSEVFPITVVIFLRQSFVDRDLKKVGCAGCPSSPWETLVVAFPHVLGPVPGRVGLRQPRLSLWGATDLLRSCEGFRLEASWRQHGQHAPPHSARHRTTSFPPPPPPPCPPRPAWAVAKKVPGPKRHFHGPFVVGRRPRSKRYSVLLSVGSSSHQAVAGILLRFLLLVRSFRLSLLRGPSSSS